MLAIAYAGSFVVMEESFEKTEKTEKSEEALQSAHLAKGLKRTVDEPEDGEKYPETNLQGSFYKASSYQLLADYNINHIYYTSYLDSHI